MTSAKELALRGAAGLVRASTAVDSLLDQILYEVRTSILPQRCELIRALDLPESINDQITSYVYDEILPMGSYESATTNFAAVALDLAQLEDSLVDLRRAISWSAKFSAFNWWIRRRQSELGIERLTVIPGPGSAREFLIERESSVAEALSSLKGVVSLSESSQERIGLIRLLTVPQLDGASAKWHPIALGHELAHLKYDAGWIEECISRIKATTPASKAAMQHAALRVGAHNTPEPALPSWYVQLLSWLIEVACDSALHYFYGPDGGRALLSYLTLHSDAADGNEHPAPALRMAVLQATAKSNLKNFREPPRAPLSSRDRKDAFIHCALHIRDQVREDLALASRDKDATERVCNSARKALESGFPPSSLDWPIDILRSDPSCVEAGLVQSIWRHKDAVDMEKAREQATTRDAEERRVDFAVDFLQFSYRFEQAKALGEEDVQPSGLPNVLFLSKDGVSLSQGALGSPSMDLRLGRHFIVFKRNEISTLNSLDGQTGTQESRSAVEIGWGNSFVLHPSEMVLAVTLESIVLDNSCSAQVLSRSSLGRMGLLSATAVHVQPGFKGTLTLELVNLASVPLRLSPGQRIAQIVPTAVCGAPEPYAGKYQNQDWRPQFSAISGDWELEILKKLAENGSEPQ